MNSTPDNSDIYNVSLDDFEQKVIDASRQRPVLVDMWADWCSPCIVIAPILAQVIETLAGRVALAKVEVDEDENMKLAGRYKVRGFPTVILFQNGEEKARFSGAQPASFIDNFIQENAEF
ncbi:Thioredoxin [hydrothermal vent metagenome]|uniref:Thioredoxin n=1 Tax=hydrothermal vent metagenome TaxID=652676 RepID=A0A3B1B6X2_9ZZZZ